MGTPEDLDTGFICKACGRFYADKEIEAGTQSGQVRSYVPNESTFRAWGSKGHLPE
jgi:hypothetical protein